MNVLILQASSYRFGLFVLNFPLQGVWLYCTKVIIYFSKEISRLLSWWYVSYWDSSLKIFETQQHCSINNHTVLSYRNLEDYSFS